VRRAEPVAEAEVVNTVIEPRCVAGLQALARSLSVSLKAVLLAAYLRVLADDGDAAACVGVVSNGRSDRLSDPLGGLGLFWNLLPFGLDSLPGATAATDAALIRAVQVELSAMEEFALYPASRVAEQQHGRSAYQATFNFIDFHNAAQVQENTDLVLTHQDGHDKFHAPLNYAFGVDRAGGAVGVRVDYDPAYFDATDINRRNDNLLQRLAMLEAAAAGLINHPADSRAPLRNALTAVELT
jgi:non-ribosomal peptide synthetase component F